MTLHVVSRARAWTVSDSRFFGPFFDSTTSASIGDEGDVDVGALDLSKPEAHLVQKNTIFCLKRWGRCWYGISGYRLLLSPVLSDPDHSRWRSRNGQGNNTQPPCIVTLPISFFHLYSFLFFLLVIILLIILVIVLIIINCLLFQPTVFYSTNMVATAVVKVQF